MLGLRCCARAFSSCGKWGPLFIAVRGPLTIVASLVAEHRLQTRRPSSCGSQAQLLCGMWDLPIPGLEPVSPALAGRFSTTAPPGKPNTGASFSQDCKLSLSFFLGRAMRHTGILVPQPGIEPVCWKRGVLTTGLPGKSQDCKLFKGRGTLSNRSFGIFHGLCLSGQENVCCTPVYLCRIKNRLHLGITDLIISLNVQEFPQPLAPPCWTFLERRAAGRVEV